MPAALESWYSLRDLMALAERGAVLEGTIELSRFDRLKGLLNSCEGSARARFAFRRSHDDVLLVELQCEAALELVCQHCLDPVTHEVRERVEFAVADTEDSLAVVPQGTESIALNGERFRPATMLEDELIVSLPLVPRHGDDKHQEK